MEGGKGVGKLRSLLPNVMGDRQGRTDGGSKERSGS